MFNFRVNYDIHSSCLYTEYGVSMRLRLDVALFGIGCLSLPLFALSAQKSHKGQEDAQQPSSQGGSSAPADHMSSGTFAGLNLRLIGPALVSGRITAIAVDPGNRAHFYVGAASGGIWETKNDGATWSPIFDHEGSYSIGALAIDPKNHSVIWAGTGEGNGQRSVAYGDGVYRSDDGGASWTNVGLKHSEHIGRIVIDPRDTNVVYVAAQGPLWNSGGDRGLYKTTDGGKTWNRILSISEHTGIADVAMDPVDPDFLYASAWQRERKQYTLVNGGQESAVYRSTDAGKTWIKTNRGLPGGDLGRIGFSVSRADHNVVYAEVEASGNKGGIFRSTDRGATWEKRNGFAAQGMYYGVIEADPKNVDRLYIMSVVIMISEDGGATVHPLGESAKHSDNHVIVIDSEDTDHLLVGCDGGVYQSHDRGKNWVWSANLPLAQFYDVATDNAEPFYFVYGGTQDNFSLGGPSRTVSANGITNADWFITQGGDGFHSQADPEDANTIYAESQYAGIVRYDRRTGESKGIRPQEAPGQPPLRWWWDSPIIISPFSHTRLYFGSNILWRSDDRGDNWQAVSPDLSRQIDRNQLPIMGRVWGPDAIEKNVSTETYGEILAISESPVKEGVIYVGTDDGLIQSTKDGGKNWKKHETFPKVPDRTFVSQVFASNHDANVVYASFDAHKSGDFHPYLLKSTDGGDNWTSISSNLGDNGAVEAFVEDPVDANLLFAGTEFGLYFSTNGGGKWIQLTGGFPVISVHDLKIQKRESDLVVATFGRGYYILDDISPLRNLKAEQLDKPNFMLPIHKAPLFIESTRLGLRGKAFQGAAYYTASNPPYGATFTYYMKSKVETRKEKREKEEAAAEKAGKSLPYPTLAELHAEAEEQAPQFFFTISDSSGKPIRQIPAVNAPGLHRTIWDLRYAGPVVSQRASMFEGEEYGPGPSAGPLAMPGTYSVTFSQLLNGVVTPLAGPQSFEVYPLLAGKMSAEDHASLAEFQQGVARLYGALYGTEQTISDLDSRLGSITHALEQTPGAYPQLIAQVVAIRQKSRDLQRKLSGDEVLAAEQEPVPESLSERVQTIMGNERLSSTVPTGTDRQNYQIASDELTQVVSALRTLVQVDLANLQKALQDAGAPWTPGVVPNWPEK
jgi:photosystem II stability/assembly factor-like uncharacterized protein